MEKSFILGLLVMLGSAKINQSWCVYYFFWIAQNGKIRIFAAPDMGGFIAKIHGYINNYIITSPIKLPRVLTVFPILRHLEDIV